MNKMKSFISGTTKFEKFNLILLFVVVLYIVFVNTRFFELTDKNYSLYELLDYKHNYYFYNERVYYTKDNILYSCDFKVDNKKIEGKLSTDNNTILYAYDNKVFYSGDIKGAGTRCFDLDAKKDNRIDQYSTTDEENIDNIIVVNNKLYYVNDKDQYKCYDLKNNKNTVIGYGSNYSKIAIDDNDEVYIASEGIIKKDKKEVFSITDEMIQCIKVYKEKLYVFGEKAIYVYDLDKKELIEKIAANGYTFTQCLDDGNVYGILNGYPVLYVYDFDSNKIKVKMNIRDVSSVKNAVEINDIIAKDNTMILVIKESLDDSVCVVYKDEKEVNTIDVTDKYMFVDKELTKLYYYSSKGKLANSYEY